MYTSLPSFQEFQYIKTYENTIEEYLKLILMPRCACDTPDKGIN